MDKWCIKAENKEQAFIIGKWFDENWNKGYDKFYQSRAATDVFHVFAGIELGNVYFTNSIGTKINFETFKRDILKQDNEPQYEIY